MQTCVTEEAEHFDVNSINIRLGEQQQFTHWVVDSGAVSRVWKVLQHPLVAKL